MTLRRKQQIWYLIADLLSSELVWLCFLGFRWMVYESRVETLNDVLVPAFSFWPPLLIYPLVCLLVYYLSGYYLRPLQKPLWREFLRTFFSAAVISLFFFFVIIIAVFLMGISFIASTSSKDQKQVLTDAVNKDIIHCYAVEGYYPPSLAYIEDHYGLTYDKSRYLVDYVPVGDNIMPSVTIVEIHGK